MTFDLDIWTSVLLNHIWVKLERHWSKFTVTGWKKYSIFGYRCSYFSCYSSSLC